MSSRREPVVVEIGAADLPLHCPLEAQKLWNSHPRVFLPVEETGEARCPYCSTVYRLAAGTVAKQH